MSSTVQLNARLSRELKESGDAALSLIGLSPTRAVRALWEKASRRGEDLEQVAALLTPPSAGRSTVAEEKGDVVAQGWAAMDEAYRSLGIDPSAPSSLPPDDELLEEALYERMSEQEVRS